jgi:hypothetical protein
MNAKGNEFPFADIENLRRGTAFLKQVIADLNGPAGSTTGPAGLNEHKMEQAPLSEQSTPVDSDTKLGAARS